MGGKGKGKDNQNLQGVEKAGLWVRIVTWVCAVQADVRSGRGLHTARRRASTRGLGEATTGGRELGIRGATLVCSETIPGGPGAGAAWPPVF